MRLSTAIICAFLAPALAMPTQDSAVSVAHDEIAKRDVIFAKRCCILCDNGNRCGARANDTREVFHTEEEALTTPEGSEVAKRDVFAKRCCILCDNPNARCGSADKREVVDTLEQAAGL